MGMMIASRDADLYVEEVGSGQPLLFLHEMGGSHRSWEPQLRHFARSHRCIVYAARGYPPSSVPTDPGAYSQEIAARDAAAVLDALGIERAHVVGLSMGSFATLQFGLDFPARAMSLTAAGCGSGSMPDGYEASQKRYEELARQIEQGGFEDFAHAYARGPVRQPFLEKDPRGWQDFADGLLANSPTGTACTLRGVQARRPSLWHLEPALVRLRVPTLLLCGDRDEPCLQPNLYLNRTLPDSRLFVFGNTGHAINLEEPELFNLVLRNFLASHA